jgi:hypothetical protein
LPDNGVYPIGLQVTDNGGLTDRDTTTVTVNNVNPIVDAGPDVGIGMDGIFNASGSFADPGADTWTATVDYGDGSGVQPLTLAAKTFALSHTYASPGGPYTATVCVKDDDEGEGCDSLLVTIVVRDKIGFWRPSTGRFHLDTNGNDIWDGPPPFGTDTRTAWFGSTPDVPVTGDFNGDGTDEVGFWRPSNGRFHLDTNGNGIWDGPPPYGTDYRTGWFGLPTDIPVTGDFDGDGTDDVGFWRPSTGRFYLDTNGNGIWDGPPPYGTDYRTGWFGLPTDTPVTGDFNGDGTDEVGFWRPTTGMFYLDTNGNGIWDGPAGGDTITGWFGGSTDTPVTGDFNGDGTDNIGFWRPSTGNFYLDTNGNGIWDGPPPYGTDTRTSWFGLPTDMPVVGNW